MPARGHRASAASSGARPGHPLLAEDTDPAPSAPGLFADLRPQLPLFPLDTVLFPGGLLPLRVFEVRYLDLISACLRSGEPFGVVALIQGGEVRRDGETVRFEPEGCLAEVVRAEPLTSGRWNLLLQGKEAVQIQEELPGKPFRQFLRPQHIGI